MAAWLVKAWVYDAFFKTGADEDFVVSAQTPEDAVRAVRAGVPKLDKDETVYAVASVTRLCEDVLTADGDCVTAERSALVGR